MKFVNAVLTTLIVMLSTSAAMAGDRAGLPFELDRLSNDGVNPFRTGSSFETSSAFADTNVEYLGSCLWTMPWDVWVEGNYAYCSFGSGLVIFDISNPAQPDTVSSLFLQGAGKNLYKLGNYIYLAAGSMGLVIIDVTDPASPVMVGSYDKVGNVADIMVLDTLAYVADRMSGTQSGLHIVDIADPANPDSIGGHIMMYAQGVYVLNSLAYVANPWGLRILNVADPTNPDSLGDFTAWGGNHVFVRDTLAYMADHGFGVINVKNPATPDSVGYIAISQSRDFAILDTLAYVGASQGLWVLNISDPAIPDSVGSISVASLYGLFVQDSLVYGTHAYYGGLEIINVVDPTAPVTAGSYDPVEGVRRVFVQDTLAFVASDSSGLQIVDISDPTAPIPIGSYGATYTHNVFVLDSLAYVATAGLDIISISDPTAPYLVGSISTPSSGWSIQIVDSLAYLTQGNRLQIYNVKDPANPDSIGSYSTGWPNDVYVQDSLAFVADDNGFFIINVSDPTNPVEVGSFLTDEYAYSVVVRNTLAYVGLEYIGVYIFDVSDPANPDTIGTFATFNDSDEADCLFLQDSMLYVANYGNGLWILNISDPANPMLAGSYETPGYAEGVFVRDSIVYLADRYSLILLKTPYGLSVGVADEVDPENLPTSFEILQNYPNPFNPSTTIEYDLPRRSHVNLSVYSLLGRKIVTLVDQVQSHGPQIVTWDGKNAQGKPVATGVYFYRIKADGFTESRKMVLLK